MLPDSLFTSICDIFCDVSMFIGFVFFRALFFKLRALIFSWIWGGLGFLLQLCEFVIRLRSAAEVPAFKGLPRWDPVSDWPSFEAESVLWLRGLVWNSPSSASL